jgi:hypothetical protein
MGRPEVNPVRSGVKAFEATHADCELFDGSWYGAPGGMQRATNTDGTLFGFVIACPGCGMCRSFMTCERGPEDRPRRDVRGNPRDVSTLTFTNGGIMNDCCGWSGRLNQGVFESLSEV